MARTRDYAGVQQCFFLDREDLLNILRKLDEDRTVRYWILNEPSVSGEFSCFPSSQALDEEFYLGVSKFGTPFDFTFGIQMEPFLEIPQREVAGKSTQDLPSAGVPLVSPGGLYEKTGELISGTIAFTTWMKNKGAKFDFRNRLSHYHDFIQISERFGGKKHKAYLIGASAWRQYEKGIPLVFQTGLKEPARFRE
ncbi:MAG: hypothetical protein M5U26_05470 [Planctomycetota bacterium]|nr:hypothetical protein [Planctomycetota bacterium]